MNEEQQNKFEYLDHTADVQIRAWGDNLIEVFENAAVAMTGYITNLDSVNITMKEEILVKGNDMLSLFYKFLDEVLFLFNAEPYLCSKRVKITQFNRPDDSTRSENENITGYSIKADCYGEPFCLGRHPQGTEIKAITYSNMNVIDEPARHEAFFIVDI